MNPIIVPLDGSALAARALPYAADLARRGGGALRLVGAVAGSGPGPSRAREYLDAVTAGLEQDGLTVRHSLVRDRPPAEAICAEAAEAAAELIVMSTHGRSGLGRFVYGSVAERVIRASPVPVLLVPASCRRSWLGKGGSIVVPLDGSDLSGAVMPRAIELAKVLGADLRLLRVIEDPYQAAVDTVVVAEPFDPRVEIDRAERYLDVEAERARLSGVTASVRASVAHPATTIAETAEEGSVVAIAMATHGRGGVMRLLMGSVASALLHVAPVPILLVRPRELGAGDAMVAAFPCHHCGASFPGEPDDVAPDARCPGCFAHVRVCGNCTYDAHDRCVLGHPRAGDPPGVDCAAFARRWVPRAAA